MSHRILVCCDITLNTENVTESCIANFCQVYYSPNTNTNANQCRNDSVDCAKTVTVTKSKWYEISSMVVHVSLYSKAVIYSWTAWLSRYGCYETLKRPQVLTQQYPDTTRALGSSTPPLWEPQSLHTVPIGIPDNGQSVHVIYCHKDPLAKVCLWCCPREESLFDKN